jgi:uncharacterized protein (TIGR00297 family)
MRFNLKPEYLGLGLVLSLVIALFAYKRQSLTQSGAIGTVIIGTIIFAIGEWTWGVLLVAFFVSSTLLSHYKERAKEPLSEKFQKGHKRDLGQVLANGGAGALIALGFLLVPHRWHFIGFIGAMATVNADTWATELGVLSKSLPRLITNGRTVSVGTSGGVSVFGTFVAFCGALFIAVLAFLLEATASGVSSGGSFIFLSYPTIIVGTIAGLAGSLFDSVLGATVQAIYFCDVDQKETESAVHRCGNKTRLIRGWEWLDNDWVNFISSIFGSLISLATYLVLVRLGF